MLSGRELQIVRGTGIVPVDSSPGNEDRKRHAVITKDPRLRLAADLVALPAIPTASERILRNTPALAAKPYNRPCSFYRSCTTGHDPPKISGSFDPGRDVKPYLEAAHDLGARLSHVVETHRQEDFVMGSAYLARLTGAQIVNGNFDTFRHGHLRLADGDAFEVGELTGDALFYGTTGRTDLADADKSVENAGLLHDSVRTKLAAFATWQDAVIGPSQSMAD